MFKCFTAIFHHVFWLKHQIGQHIFVPLLAHPLQVEDGSEWQGVRETGTTCMFHNCPTSLSVCTAFFILDGFWMFLIISNYTCVCMLCVCMCMYICIYIYILAYYFMVPRLLIFALFVWTWNSKCVRFQLTTACEDGDGTTKQVLG